MSSGTLPLGTYHRANALGAGTYGSVVQVYDEDGNEYALKLFEEEEENDDEEEEYNEQESTESSDNEDYDNDEDEMLSRPLDLGALREISILRLLRHENSHPNIVSIHDVKQGSDIMEDDQADRLMQYPGITMKLFQYGTLSKIIMQNLDKKTKIDIAHGILSGVAYLHQNGIIHRDIKADNIMMDIDDDGTYHPVLIDFSLSKIIVPQCMYGAYICQDDSSSSSSSSNVKTTAGKKVQMFASDITKYCTDLQGEVTHTPNIGTPTYRAPECISGKSSYGLPSDMYSVGVVLLELLRGSCIESFKDRGASKIVESELESLPNQPFANLIRALLQKDPTKRMTARDALQHEVFKKFGFINNDIHLQDRLRTIDIEKALPLDGIENDPEGFLDSKKSKKRMQVLQTIANDLDAVNPFTVQAAFCYSLQLAQLDDCIDNLSESQGLIDCVVLAHKFFEKELWNLKDIETLDRGTFKKCNWSASNYIDTEGTIWMLMDFCLYPRKLWI